MRKSILLIFFGALTYLEVNGQWVGTSLEFTSPGTSYTKFQFAEHTWSGSHAILFNAYKSVSVSGSLLSTGNTKYANNAGTYGGGAASIIFNGNGGSMNFMVSPTSTGIDNNIDWGGSKMTILRSGNVGIGTTSPAEQFTVSAGNSGDAVIRIESDLDNNLEGDNSRIEMFQDGGSLGAYIGFNQDWPVSAGDAANLFRIGTRYSDVDYFDRLVINSYSGNVGLGTTSPTGKLHLYGSGDQNLKIWSEDASSRIYFRKNNTGHDGMIAYHTDGRMGFSLDGSGAGGLTTNEFLTIRNNGSVGIGTTTPTEKLEVNGTIRSKEVKVEASPWPDYVFEPNYELRSLEEIEKFIQSEKHLPDVPSAAEVEENGIALGEMNALLLKKVEELTLHTIAQEAKIRRLEEAKRQEPKANSLEKRIEELTLYTISQETKIEKLNQANSQQLEANNQLLLRLEKLEQKLQDEE